MALAPQDLLGPASLTGLMQNLPFQCRVGADDTRFADSSFALGALSLVRLECEWTSGGASCRLAESRLSGDTPAHGRGGEEKCGSRCRSRV
ncbi:hypothetical protein IG631_06273 [Alternaria alternata]|nr:hypothetical protein IG631_06273 [Alternaria alternata]